jgi:LacI family transcriptional regulator
MPASGLPPPRVLVVLDTCAAWSRGILRGFAQVAHEHGWLVLHFHPGVDLDWLTAQWPIDAVLLGPAQRGPWPERLRQSVSVSINADRSAEGIASVYPNDARVAELAVSHFLARGVRNLTTFRFDGAPFAVERDRRFCEVADSAGARLEPSWFREEANPPSTLERPTAIANWLSGLRKPCGVFACCDAWARVVARYARIAGLRVPEDVALIGVDNDAIECETMAPPLSSIALPWRTLGANAAELVLRGLRGEAIGAQRVLVAPVDVVLRRSSDTFAVDDPLVATAVAWIHGQYRQRLTVPMIAAAAGATRQRLERHFRRALGRTVMQETRRARVEVARRLLSTSDLPLLDVAKQSGFTTAALMSVAFRLETGMPPGAYRRRARGELAGEDE